MNRENEALLIIQCLRKNTFEEPKLLMSSPCCQIFSGPWKLFPLSKFFPRHTDKISSADLQDFLNFLSQPKFPQSEGHLPPSGARTLVRFMLPCAQVLRHPVLLVFGEPELLKNENLLRFLFQREKKYFLL